MKVNRKYFSRPNTSNSYWAGFLAADGYIKSKNTVCCSICLKDKVQLEDFKQDCGFEGKIYEYHNPTSYGEGYRASLTVCDVDRWVDDLAKNFKVVPKKSLILERPELSYKNSLAYIKGYIDGDGCISTYKSNGREFIELTILGTEDVLSWIKDIFDKIAPNTKSVSCVRKKDDSNIFVYKVSNARARRVLAKIENSCGFGLKRKWDKVST